jgi:predicted TIM-barrel fold metal-dependent hydrolase
LLYSSDYPHWDTSWPNTVRTVRERDDITEAQKKQFLSDNVQSFYGFTAKASNSV